MTTTWPSFLLQCKKKNPKVFARIKRHRRRRKICQENIPYCPVCADSYDAFIFCNQLKIVEAKRSKHTSAFSYSQFQVAGLQERRARQRSRQLPWGTTHGKGFHLWPPKCWQIGSWHLSGTQRCTEETSGTSAPYPAVLTHMQSCNRSSFPTDWKALIATLKMETVGFFFFFFCSEAH